MHFATGQELYSVSSLTKELKNMVENEFRFIQVQGEISNMRRPYSGHAYFTLKDQHAQLKSVLFKGSTRYLEKPVADGQLVICHGRISIYEPRGDYQLIVDSVDFKGAGTLQQRFEKLKMELAAEGLFDAQRKKEIIPFPAEIVLVTSPGGAAVHDFLKIWRAKKYPINIKIFPVRVQGDSAAGEIIHALTTINRELPQTDVIVLARGGGSLEDLQPFNEEILARAIVRSKLPILSAVGHEVDFTISDFCADVRAATPTAAAEILVADATFLCKRIKQIQSHLIKEISSTIADFQYIVDQNRRLLGDMELFFTNATLRLDHLSLSLQNILITRLAGYQGQCDILSNRLLNNSPVARLAMQEQRLTFTAERLSLLFFKILHDKEAEFSKQAGLLDAVSPLATLSRGYGIGSKIDRKTRKKILLRESNQVREGDLVELRLYKGKILCDVVEPHLIK